MYLINTPKLRVQKYRKGHVVEIQRRNWYGKLVWKHAISIDGTGKEPWYFSDHDIAIFSGEQSFFYNLQDGTDKYAVKDPEKLSNFLDRLDPIKIIVLFIGGVVLSLAAVSILFLAGII
jgi:hypothetical protein